MNGPALAAAAVTLVAVWCCIPPPVRRLTAATRTRTRRVRPEWLVAAGAVLVAGLVSGTSGVVWGLLAIEAGATGWFLGSQWRQARRRAVRQAEVAQAAQLVAGQLRAGAVPSRALQSVARDCPWLERTAATQAIGGDVPRALLAAAQEPGREGLASLARAWELGELTGAPVALLALRVTEQLRVDEDTRGSVAAELSGPRATSRLLAFLPAIGIAMGGGAGGHPIGFLLDTLPGQLCLLAGVGLACVGLVWTELMARRAGEGS